MHNTLTYKVARGLGWFSIGLGVVEVLTPGLVNRLVGAREGHAFIRAFGVREVAAGTAILTLSNPTPWVWARFAGDLMDMAALALAMNTGNPDRHRAAKAIIGVAAVTAVDFLVARGLGALTAERQRPRRDYSARSGLGSGASPAQPPEATAESGFRTVTQGTNVKNRNVAKITR